MHKLRVPASLRKTLASTNVIESAFSIVEMICRNVKRWRGGDHLERWVGSALLVAEKKFRRVRGYQQIPQLLGALTAPTFKERSCQRCRSCLTYENRSRYFQRQSGQSPQTSVLSASSLPPLTGEHEWIAAGAERAGRLEDLQRAPTQRHAMVALHHQRDIK